jgi:hypothetical protein
MGETVDSQLTVRQARRLLSDTSRVAPERVREAETLIRELHSRRPAIMPGGGVGVALCQNCGNGTWSLHSDGDTELWAAIVVIVNRCRTKRRGC